MPLQKSSFANFFILSSLLLLSLTACTRSAEQNSRPWTVSGEQPGKIPTAVPVSSGERTARPPGNTPTPDPPHNLPDLRNEPEQYVVQAGDTLGQIAQGFNVTIEQLVEANQLPNPDFLEVGQVLTVPVPEPGQVGPAIKIIPDSELVYGPGSAQFNLSSFIQQKGGYLANYLEEVNGQTMTGAQIVLRVAQNYSVNPRLLLAILEYQSGWVTQASPQDDTLDFPIGFDDNRRAGLYRQLAWAADNLNRGYYLWRVSGVSAWTLADGLVIPVAPTINAGTAGVQQFFANLFGDELWRQAVSEEGLLKTFTRLFEYPFNLGFEPLLPNDLTQPEMQLPFESGETWAFTGGPHGAWDSGSAWGALDFAPPGEALGCVSSDAWVVAVADGLIVRAGEGAVIEDLDFDGLEQTGWTVLYMHIESRDRILPGTRVVAGDKIGHPSCEGGVTTGTHLHIARRYNGEWIPADQSSFPFVMDGWRSQGTGIEYDGFLVQNGNSVEAWNGREEGNEIQR